MLAFLVTWIGLGIAYFSPYPVGFWVTSLSFGLYVLVRAVALCSRPAVPAANGGARERRRGGRGLMFAHEFMRNAYLAGTFVALACGVIGYFVVLRAQVFAGDALSHVAFAGALAAAAIGIDIRLGLFAATLVGRRRDRRPGRARPRRRRRDRHRLRLDPRPRGALPLDLRQRLERRRRHRRGARPLRLDPRPLRRRRPARRGDRGRRLSSPSWRSPGRCCSPRSTPRSPAGSASRCGLLGVAFFVILGAVAAEATQAVGALLLLGLLAAPGGAARLLTDRPWLGLALAGAIAVGSMWLGLLLSYEIDSLPAGTAVIGVATAAFLLAAIRDRLRAGGVAAAAPDRGGDGGD